MSVAITAIIAAILTITVPLAAFAIATILFRKFVTFLERDED